MINQFIRNKIEKGQVIPLVVLMMFVIIAMVALILDGGAIMSNRRTAQAAADAGALAGAQRLCKGSSDAQAVAEAYVVKNHADVVSVTIEGRVINVVAKKENPSFFAKILGEDLLLANAEAEAGCYYPSAAKRILPIAFYYERAPVNSDDISCTEDGICNLVNWDFIELMDALSTTPVLSGNVINLPLDDIYVISESTKVCEKDITGTIVCSEMAANASGGNRSFIDLGESNLLKIIQNGIENPIHLPAYLNGQTGVVAAVYDDKNYEGFDTIIGYEDLNARLFFVPVFDKYCDPGSIPGCPYNDDFSDLPAGVTPPNPISDAFIYLVSDTQQSYRLLGFAPFVVTCTTMNEQCAFGECVPDGTWYLGPDQVTVDKDICPGYLALREQLGEEEDLTKDAIEGYFVDDFPADQWVWGTGGVDVGIYLISLSK